MDFRQIEAFVNVVKYKGFSKAAEATFLTQPTISAHINALENELEMQLIDRMGKTVMLTPEGKVFYNYALTMLNTREQAVCSLRNFSLNINGTIDIQASSIPGEYIVPSLIAGFKAEYNMTKFKLEQSDSSAVSNSIKANRGDIGFTGKKEKDGLTYKTIMRDKNVLITPSSEKYKKFQGKRVELREIAGESFILREHGSGTRAVFEKKINEKGLNLDSINIAAKMNSTEAIKQAVKGGLGVSIISEVAAQRNRIDNGYMVFDLADYDKEREFYMVYNDKVTMSPTVEAFKYYVMEKCNCDKYM